MSAIARPTNGDVIAPHVDKAKAAARQAVAYYREHPDELAVGAVPFMLLSAATLRHRLSLWERVILGECAFWGGVLAMEQYRNWKDKPAGVTPLRKVR